MDITIDEYSYPFWKFDTNIFSHTSSFIEDLKFISFLTNSYEICRNICFFLIEDILTLFFEKERV